jgi:uncharacterized membrane protein
MINESHERSILKGISWRIIATTDTFLVVFFITCMLDQCSVENALKIGVIEFFLKLLIYYTHERVWLQFIKSFIFSKQQSLLKTISWRLVATTTTFIISGAVLNEFNEIALFIALLELISKFILYYFHERIWIRIPLGLKKKNN